MELALSLEKLTNEKLLNLHSVASKNGDVQLADLLDSKYLGEQFAAWNYGVVIIWFDVLQFSYSGFSCKEKDLNLNVALVFNLYAYIHLRYCGCYCKFYTPGNENTASNYPIAGCSQDLSLPRGNENPVCCYNNRPPSNL
ncbi:hypothetical protein RIF29_20420 [Crotalaria pallida]|uniref:Uncharacterized protein n=1 Tax=Crotalaria pallida TaxID=3830 RepID=A0AAN9F2H9_CROPI